MKCKYCGKEVLRGSEYCPGCGKSLTEKPVNKIFKIFAAASILDLLKYIITFLASTCSAVLYTISSSSGQSMEVRSTLYYALIIFALILAAISYLLKLFWTVKNRKADHHFTYAIICILVSMIISILSYAGVFGSGNLRSIMAIVINAVDVVFTVMITLALKDFADHSRKTALIEKANNSIKIFTILGVVGCLLISIAIPAIYIIYFILLKQAIEEL